MDAGAPRARFLQELTRENGGQPPRSYSVSLCGILQNLPTPSVPGVTHECNFAESRQRRVGSEKPDCPSQFMDFPLNMYVTVWPRTRPRRPSE